MHLNKIRRKGLLIMTFTQQPFSIISNKKFVRAAEGAGFENFVYTHIPKCGGNSFFRIVRSFVCYKNLSMMSLSGSQLSYKNEALLLSDLVKNAKEYQLFNCFFGHIPFSSSQKLFPRHRFITLLRDPAERLLSAFYYMHKSVSKNKDLDKFISLMKFSDTSGNAYAVDNMQVRMLCTRSSFDEPCTPRMLENAKENLQNHYSLFGTTERANDFFSRFITISGMPSVVYKPANVNSAKPVIDKNSAIYDAAMSFNKLDCELYQWAQRNAQSANLEFARAQEKITPHEDEFLYIHGDDNNELEIYFHKQPIPGSLKEHILPLGGKAIHQNGKVVFGAVPV